MLWRLTLKTNPVDAEHIGQVLEPYVLAVSWYEDSEREELWVLEATVAKEPDLSFFQALVDATADLKGFAPLKITAQPIEDQDWLEATWRSFPPLTVGAFYIYGSHCAADVPPSLKGIEINAATAFGSGEHETTQGCLTVLCELAKEHQFDCILDMGCGSGILGIAASKLWQVPVVAADNDPESVKVTTGNAQLNKCAALIRPHVSAGFQNPQISEQGPYNLIVANI